MQSYISVGFSLPRKIREKIDVERGDISRSRYLLRLLERVYISNEEHLRGQGVKGAPKESANEE